MGTNVICVCITPGRKNNISPLRIHSSASPPQSLIPNSHAKNTFWQFWDTERDDFVFVSRLHRACSLEMNFMTAMNSNELLG